ncbi:MAG: SBBP repeat-containing protein [Bacteroidia bacterium]|nr:SBBP repeat-containing protein [Bacteroidia bacterium]
MKPILLISFFTFWINLQAEQIYPKVSSNLTGNYKLLSQDKNKDGNSIKEQVKQWINAKPICFLENNGQLVNALNEPVPFVYFKASVPGFDTYVTEKGVTYVFVKNQINNNITNENKQHSVQLYEFDKNNEERKTEMAWINVSLIGASIKKENIIKEKQCKEYYNYFYAHCPDGIYNTKHYEKITIKDIYTGIDWVLYTGNKTGIKYDFIVHPGADAGQIKLNYESETPLSIDKNGNIQLETKLGKFTERAPYSYFLETAVEVKSKFIKKYINPHNVEITYQLNNSLANKKEKSNTLIIDPQLVWGTFYGSTGDDVVNGIDHDSNGNIFAAGFSYSGVFPTMNAGTYFQAVFGNMVDAVILKFNNSGVRLWATYYGGNSLEGANDIAVDGNNNLFVTGYTNSLGFPLLNSGTYFQGNNIFMNVFVLKFANSGNRLWATRYGNTTSFSNESGNSIAIDNLNNVFVTGTAGANFPLQNPGGTTYFQFANAGGNDAFILKFDNIGNRLWATYYGGGGVDNGLSIDVDGSNNIFVCGSTQSVNFPVFNAGGLTFFQGANGGGTDIFILKFDNSGSQLWATYYGGTLNESGVGIICNGNTDVCIGGTTTSANFPILNPGGFTFFQAALGGTQDVFIMKFDNGGVRQWATYIGGSGVEWTFFDNCFDIDSCGNLFFGFDTYSKDMQILNPSGCGFFDASFNTDAANANRLDCFITKFSNTGTLLWATYLGGTAGDQRTILTIDDNNNLFIATEIYANSAGIPLVNPGGGAYFDSADNNGDIGFFKFIPNNPQTITASSLNPDGCGSCNGSASIKVNCGNNISYDFIWSNGNQTTGSANTTSSLSGLCPGSYSINVKNKCVSLDTTITFILTEQSGITVSTTSNNGTCDPFGISTVIVSGGTGPYTYSWSPSGQTTAIATGLNSGVYTVTATDGNGCTATATSSISAPIVLSGQFTKGSANCKGCSCKEWLMVTASGGTSPYSYSWPDGYTNRYKNQLCPGAYTINIKDKNGCSVNISLTTP